MTATGWRTLAILLGVACAFQTWRACGTRGPTRAACERFEQRQAGRGSAAPERSRRAGDRPDRVDTRDDDDPPEAAASAFGIAVPDWVRWLAPRPDEDLLAYRDRIVPLAQAAVAPQRARVARLRDEFFAAAELDGGQRGLLDQAVAEAATEIQDRILDGVLGGELLPPRLTPTAGVRATRDVLDAVLRADQRFEAALREDQRAALAAHGFDVADYLLFSTRWEAALGVE